MNQQAILEFFISNQWITIPAFVILVVGVTLCWFGGLMAALTAIGNQRWVWGLVTIFLGPITGIPYSLLYREAEYPRSLMMRGLLIVLAALVIFAIAWLLI
ncbi:hypothetical protein KUV95_03545 [Microbulbifer agarilyticus]|uniref:hypothetical protein n=1 Tax=Microbulbifer agarilyticus TaxID=260552 RepID=UPI001C988924|nr:hypothetical protein [Microbulbifer agarilyticus]MBY6210612.1 hypothetical protein [Microbulbifer agarilyticus]